MSNRERLHKLKNALEPMATINPEKHRQSTRKVPNVMEVGPPVMNLSLLFKEAGNYRCDPASALSFHDLAISRSRDTTV